MTANVPADHAARRRTPIVDGEKTHPVTPEKEPYS